MIAIVKIRFYVITLLLAAMMGLAANAAGSKSVEAAFFDPEKVTWRNLTFRASGFLGKVDTRVSISVLPAGKASADFIATPGNDAVHAAGPFVFSTRIKTSIKPLVGFDEVLTTRAWIDCASAAALQRIRLRVGREKWQKSYRYTDTGVFRIRKKPEDANEANQPPPEWTKVREAFYAYPAGGKECITVMEPGSLLLVASVLSRMQPDRNIDDLCVFNKKQLHRIKVSVNGRHQLAVNYEVISGKNQSPGKHRIDAVKMSFFPTSLHSADEATEEFSFLGLKGPFDIYVDRISGLPVQISGRVATFGKLQLKLHSVDLDPGFSSRH